jgi:CMP-N-acetylneuraminic acid synthetase
MRVLGLVPARGGSKGIPRKNIKLLAGKPLLQWTADAALKARTLTRVVLSTEDSEIAEIGASCGLTVPFLRPSALAADDTSTLAVVVHALQTLEKAGERYDAVCVLQPTSPLRRSSDIDACVTLLAESNADCVVSVLPVPLEYNPHWVYFREGDGSLRLSTGEPEPLPRRQMLPGAFHRDGSVYVSRSAVVIDGRTLYGSRVLGYEMTSESVNLDTPGDWAHAESLIRAL